ncbi:hypothetical protein [Dysgonomonas sp. BGC7]|uniref:hypothetical protein n=1 Tax=Dysgonomonas sp. BGC7 TaxID=1658008 RepID=UPI000681EBEA|nr:hypothetical protein [Dysgonomonas sp. BGC7]MBD8387413.1 hypothetical protein [Dysgonomonas sp. BGC7]
MKIEKGFYYSFKLKFRKQEEQGVVIDEGEDWILTKYIFSDYMVDGFILFNKKFIKTIERGENEIFFEKVLSANNKMDLPSRLSIPLSTKKLMKWLKDTETPFQIDGKDESVCYIGRILEILNKSIRFKDISAKGIWADGYDLYRMDSLMMISFDTDYINSIIIYANSLKE